jgi:ABC-type amino acid transport substrate-binding protein
MMRLRLVAIAVLLLAAPHALAEPARLHTLVPGALRVGTYFVNPPFEFLANGERVGFEVDLIGEVARRLELRPYFVNTHWQVILRQMHAGGYDCIVGGITITPARRQILRWSAPYMTTTHSLIVDSFRTPGIQDLADLAGGTVGVQAATTDYDAAIVMQHRGQIKGVKVYPFDRIGRALTDLAAGRISAVMKVYPVAAWLAQRTPGLRIVAQVPDDPQPLGIGFNRNNPALATAVDAALAEIQRDGSYASLVHKWGLP